MLQPNIEKALAAEIQYSKEFQRNQMNRSTSELRKEGWCLDPCNIKECSEGNRSAILTIGTSYIINTTYFKRGASVQINQSGKKIVGRIFDINAYDLTVSANEIPDDFDLYGPIEVFYVPDDRTLHCMELGLKFLREKKELHHFQSAFEANEIVSKNHSDHRLNESQELVVSNILSASITTVVQGPPGTGKTHTLAVAIEQLVQSGKRVLISAPSNTAVDNLCRACIRLGIQPLRVGNEEKIAPDILPYSLDEIMSTNAHAKAIESMRQQLKKFEQVANKQIRNYTQEAAQEKRNARKEMRALRSEIRQQIQGVERLLLEKSTVIAGTPVGLFNALQPHDLFDVLILDEAGQCMSPLNWLIAVFAKKMVLCGDPQQLPPTVLSQEAKMLGLGESLLEAICRTHSPLLLNEQYRMELPIGPIVSALFYNNEVWSNHMSDTGNFTFIDTAGYDAREFEDEASGSISNPGEVDLIKKIIQDYEFPLNSTVVITPYNAQLEELRKTFPTWHVSTIDSIQGQEKDHVIISMVRSNEEGNIGFLNDYRRTNVAISRAKKTCILIGDSSTLAADKFYAHCLEIIEQRGIYRSAWEFVD
jgi:superfamily I DNA and/or RNA helicase